MKEGKGMRLMTVKEASKFCKCTTFTVRNAVRDERITPAARVGKGPVFDPKEVERWNTARKEVMRENGRRNGTANMVPNLRARLDALEGRVSKLEVLARAIAPTPEAAQ